GGDGRRRRPDQGARTRAAVERPAQARRGLPRGVPRLERGGDGRRRPDGPEPADLLLGAVRRAAAAPLVEARDAVRVRGVAVVLADEFLDLPARLAPVVADHRPRAGEGLRVVDDDAVLDDVAAGPAQALG